MKRSKKLAAVFTFGLWTLTAAPAEAATFFLEYTGTVTGQDNGGVFGTPRANLSGQSFVAHFVFDTSLGSLQNGEPYYQILNGGRFYGNTSPALAATLSVNGVLTAVAGGFDDEAFASPFQRHSSVSNEFGQTLSATISGFNLPGTFGTSFSEGVDAYGNYNSGSGTNLSLRITGVSGGAYIPPAVSPVPEPATWAMMLLGFGAVGLAMRRWQHMSASVEIA